MTHPQTAHPAQPDHTAWTDLVPGEPPVPVNIWRLPSGEDAPVGARLAARLLAEYTRTRELVYDTLPSPALRKAAHAAGRGYRPASRFQAPTDRAALAVVVWPITDQRLDPVIVLGGLRRRLRPGGFLAVIVANPDAGAVDSAPVELGPLVRIATAAGLSYLQHIVTMPADKQPQAESRHPSRKPRGPRRPRAGARRPARLLTDRVRGCLSAATRNRPPASVPWWTCRPRSG